MFKITNAPITPGIHPHNVNRKIIINDPHPLSIMESGGKNIANNTLKILIVNRFFILKTTVTAICYNYDCTLLSLLTL
ncbi:hypothetical protein T190820D02B_90087 [Tenacibaculum sp. 190524A05c]